MDYLYTQRNTCGDILIKIILIIIKGMEYLHKCHVIHRDLKGQNILFTDKACYVCLVDFGVSAQMDKTVAKRNTFIGTPYWMAPEVIECDQNPNDSYDYKCDIWSIGIVGIEMADGVPPLADHHPMRALYLIASQPPPKIKSKKSYSELFNNLITSFLIKKPSKRPSATQLLTNKLFSSIPDDGGKTKIEISEFILENSKRRGALNVDVSENELATAIAKESGIEGIHTLRHNFAILQKFHHPIEKKVEEEEEEEEESTITDNESGATLRPNKNVTKTPVPEIELSNLTLGVRERSKNIVESDCKPCKPLRPDSSHAVKNDSISPTATGSPFKKAHSCIDVTPSNPVLTDQFLMPQLQTYQTVKELEIYCAAHWGINILLGTRTGLFMLDRSGQGQVIPIIQNRRFIQICIIEELNTFLTVGGKKNRLCSYKLSSIKSALMNEGRNFNKIPINDKENCLNFSQLTCHGMKFIIATYQDTIDLLAWAPKPQNRFMLFRSFDTRDHIPLKVYAYINPIETKMSIVYACKEGFYSLDLDSINIKQIASVPDKVTIVPIGISPTRNLNQLCFLYNKNNIFLYDLSKNTGQDIKFSWSNDCYSIDMTDNGYAIGWSDKSMEIRNHKGSKVGRYAFNKNLKYKLICSTKNKLFFCQIGKTLCLHSLSYDFN